MSTINAVPFRSTIFYTAAGVPAATGSVLTIGSNGVGGFTTNLGSTMVSIGASTNQTYNNFTNGSYVTWQTAKSAMTSANKTVQSANGLYQLVVANTTSNLSLSSDSGITWSTLTGGLPTLTGSAYWSDGAISANGQYITLSMYGGSLWMSQDYGRTFALTNQPTPNIWLPLNGNTTDSMGLSVVTTPGTVPGYVTVNYPGYTAQAVNLLNTAGSNATRYIRGTWTGSPNFTVSFWMNPQTVNGSQQTVFSTYTGGIQVYIQPSTNYLFYQIPSGGASGVINGQVVTTYALSVNTWYYITIIFQTNGLCSLYINNTLIGSATNVGGYGTYVPTPFSLGTYDIATTNAFNGYVADLRITNSVSTYVPIPLLQPNIWMPFENSTADLGSNAITPTVTGSLSYVPGVVGLNAVNLVNGAGGSATNYIMIPWSTTSNFTVSLWFNLQSVGGTYIEILSADTNGWFETFITVSTMTLAIQLPSGGSQIQVASAPVVLNTWYHLVQIFQSNGTCSVFLNGASIGSATNTSGTSGTSWTNLTIGRETGSNASAFNGYIDDFRIYNAAIPIHVLFPQNYRSLALSGTGQYALAAAASGWVVGSSNSGQTWSKQAVSVGTQSDYIQPNLSGLGANTWFANGVTWTASSSPNTSNGYFAFNNNFTVSNNWLGQLGPGQYNASGIYTGTTSTTIIGVGSIGGEWVQIQSSVPLILSSYLYAAGNRFNHPKTMYIVGSNDGTNWYPLQLHVLAANPFTTDFTTASTYIIMNLTGTQTVTAQTSQTVTTTAYASTTQAFTYFRVIINTNFLTSIDCAQFGELYLNFIRPLTSSRPPTHALSMNHTGQYQLVATGPAAGSIMPNQTGLTSATWTQGGVNWTASASSAGGVTPAYKAFNNVNAVSSDKWETSAVSYTGSVYSAGIYSTTIQTVGPIGGEWLQIQSSVPLVLTSYSLGTADVIGRISKTYYIAGSNDGSTWYPVQYCNFTTTPFTTAYTNSSYVTVNYSGTQTITAGQSGSATTATYSTTANAYSYFRMIVTNLFSPESLLDIGELYLNFSNSVSYSSNYGSTWLNTSRTVSNESVALSASGQYALSTNSVVPLARLTLDNTNVDAQGVLVPATGLGTPTYPADVFKVGSNAVKFTNTASAVPIMYLNYTVPAVLNMPSAITMACWVYPTTLSGNSTPIILNNGPASGTYANEFYISSTGQVNLFWSTTVNSTGSLLSSSTYISANSWSHLALTLISGVITVYVNGTSAATVNAGGLLCAVGGGNLTNLIIGTAGNGGGGWAGYVDDVRIYTSGLNAHEVAALYNNPAITQTIAVSNSYLPITSYTKPVLPGITANIVDAAVSQTGQYMVAVTSSTTNNVYYSTDYGATFTALTVGTSAMVSCSISYDGSYLTVENATTVYTLNRNTRGFSVTVGNQAGLINQAQNAIAIGDKAGQTNQSANSIVINATGTALDAAVPGFYVAPVATAASSSAAPFNLLGYGTDNQIVQSSALTVLQNGNMGIGTANPYSALHVYGNSTGKIIGFISNANTALGSSACLQYGLWPLSGSSQTGTNSPSAEISAISLNAFNGNTDLAFSVYTGVATTPNYTLVERMRITAAGNVGIGTATPSANLHIYNSSASFTGAPTVHIGDGQADAGGTYGMVNLVRANNAADNKAHLSFIKNGLSVFGMGFFPGTGLSVFGLIPSFSTMNVSAGLWIDNTGSVGIGSTAPGSRLDVSGTILGRTRVASSVFTTITIANTSFIEYTVADLGCIATSTVYYVTAIATDTGQYYAHAVFYNWNPALQALTSIFNSGITFSIGTGAKLRLTNTTGATKQFNISIIGV